MASPLLQRKPKVALDAVLENIGDPAHAQADFHIDPDYGHPMGQKGTEPENVHYGHGPAKGTAPDEERLMKEYLEQEPTRTESFPQFRQRRREEESKDATTPLPTQEHDPVDDGLNPADKIFKRSIELENVIASAGGRRFMYHHLKDASSAAEHMKYAASALSARYPSARPVGFKTIWAWCETTFPKSASWGDKIKKLEARHEQPIDEILKRTGKTKEMILWVYSPELGAKTTNKTKDHKVLIDALIQKDKRWAKAVNTRDFQRGYGAVNFIDKVIELVSYAASKFAPHEISSWFESKFPGFTLEDASPSFRGIYASGEKKCPKCGSTDFGLMPTDFETAKCSKCGNNWNYGIPRRAAVEQHTSPIMLPQRDDMRSHLDEDVKKDINDIIDKPVHEGIKIGDLGDAMRDEQDQHFNDQSRDVEREAHDAFMTDSWMLQEAEVQGMTLDELWLAMGDNYTNDYTNAHHASVAARAKQAGCPNCKRSKLLPVASLNFKTASQRPMAECGSCGSFFTF